MSAAVVSFDCWNTLLSDVDPERSRDRQVDAVVAAALTPLPRDRAAEILDGALAGHTMAWRAGRHHGLGRIVAELVDRLGVGADAAPSLAAALSQVDPEDVRLTPSAEATLATLRSRGYRLALVCDTGVRPGEIVRGLLAAHGVLERLDALAFSDEVGAPKPDPRMFEAVLSALGADPARSVHVGDLVPTDVLGGHRAGMRTVLFTGLTPPPEQMVCEPDHVIGDLADLPALLETA